MERRTFLTGAAAALALPVADSVQARGVCSDLSIPTETPCEKTFRLASELAAVLNESADGRMHAVIYPSQAETFAVRFIVTNLGQRDPLLETIREYQAGFDAFNEQSSDVEEWNTLCDQTYAPAFQKLSTWEGAATTREGAAEALRIALLDDRGVYQSDAADRMVEAALG